MKNDTTNIKLDEAQNSIDSCGTNSTFNFIVGTIAIITATIAGYIAYNLLLE